MYNVMVEFAKKQTADNSTILFRVLNGKKPFRTFKDQIIYLGVQDDWFDFELAYAKDKIMQWLEEM